MKGSFIPAAIPKLMEVLKVSEVESFSEDGRHYVVLEAPDEAYVEAFFHAINREALELHALDADWTNPTMQHLSIAQRLGAAADGVVHVAPRRADDGDG